MKKRIVRALSFLFLCFVLICGLFTSCGKKSVKVGFCNLSDEVQATIESCFYDIDDLSAKFVFEKIPSINQASVKKISKKYDLIFGFNGENISNLKAVANSVSEDVLLNLPDSIRHETWFLPILLDHYGFCYSVPVKSKSKIRYPGSFSDFEKYLKRISGKVNYPLFVNCGTDRDFIAFFGAICESIGGIEGYNSFNNALASYENLESFKQTVISKNWTIGTVLNLIKEWQKKGYMHPGWCTSGISDFQNLSMDGLIGVGFMSLSEFHGLNYDVAKDFVCDRVPVLNPDIAHGLIAPSVVCVSISDNLLNEKIMLALVSADSQKNLSKGTTLAPAAIQGQAYDKQSDDVRFLAAACLGGPVCDSGSAIFESKGDKLHLICEDLRLFFK